MTLGVLRPRAVRYVPGKLVKAPPIEPRDVTDPEPEASRHRLALAAVGVALLVIATAFVQFAGDEPGRAARLARDGFRWDASPVRNVGRDLASTVGFGAERR
jgi:hypothetical protein